MSIKAGGPDFPREGSPPILSPTLTPTPSFWALLGSTHTESKAKESKSNVMMRTYRERLTPRRVEPEQGSEAIILSGCAARTFKNDKLVRRDNCPVENGHLSMMVGTAAKKEM
ncbi:hypothetical protein I7I51_05900 [Histoplasma capsulatum]|uniref:Uncharacterized protein n=1 Tax=Ajellomyces capsulatus TaxID=5037 RepID=A0A8A1MGJ9_AJECA|nr:predicted protein [Histoplasma mississippiense (nom. inval.)]EDN05535.1 predicted protein [Histoplasma mississippiense (nom. inval.)]QSS65059.1 hypothetical protein I7I51_05900 [Histoplasma capsulatum]